MARKRTPLSRRLLRRTMQPRRPLAYPDQWGLVLLTVLAIAGGVALVLVAVLGR